MRFPRAVRCPRCGAEELVDLRSPKGRKRARASIHSVFSFGWIEQIGGVFARVRQLYWPWGAAGTFVLATTVGLAFGLGLVEAILGGAVAALMLPVAVVPVQLAAMAGLVLLMLGAGILSIALLPFGKYRDPTDWFHGRQTIGIGQTAALPAGAQRCSVRGKVRVAEPILAPISDRPCVAFRVVGAGPSGEVDDAGARSFELVTAKGEIVAVELGDATVDLRVGRPSAIAVLSKAARSFLEDRGVLLAPGPVRASEAVVVGGDVVEVEGTVTEESRPDGYRGMRTVRVLRDAPEAPLVIRRPCGSDVEAGE